MTQAPPFMTREEMLKAFSVEEALKKHIFTPWRIENGLSPFF